MTGDGQFVRAIATIGMGIGAPLALFSGIGVGVTLIGGPPVFLVLLLVIGLGMTAVSLIVYAAADAHERAVSGNGEDQIQR